MPPWTAGRIAEVAGATCEGDDSVRIAGLAPLDEAGPTDLSFCVAPCEALEHTHAGAVLLAEGWVPEGTVALRCENPRLAFARVAEALVPVTWPEPGVHPTAVVSPEAMVEGSTVGPYCVVESGVVLGEGTWLVAHVYVGAGVLTGARCRLLPHSAVLERCTLGERVTLHPGAVVGSDGFGFAAGSAGPVRVPQLGTVVLGDGVEVGASTTVDRAALGATRLGAGTALDNLVMIGHGVHTGEGCLFVAYSGAAGSARLGDGVQLGARAGVREGVTVGEGARLAGGATATVDVPAGATIAGLPAVPYARWLQELAALRRLPELAARVRELERRFAGEEED